MKRILSLTLTLLIIISMCTLVASCAQGDNGKLLYTEDTALGTGSKTFTFVFDDFEGNDITFTISTNKTILADALREHDLIDGEEGDFGLYVKRVNGILHDFDKDATYWSLYIGDDYALTGVDTTEITDGATYRFKATR